jgi:uncharacterized protein (DUF2062 family)
MAKIPYDNLTEKQQNVLRPYGGQGMWNTLSKESQDLMIHWVDLEINEIANIKKKFWNDMGKLILICSVVAGIGFGLLLIGVI